MAFFISKEIKRSRPCRRRRADRFTIGLQRVLLYKFTSGHLSCAFPSMAIVLFLNVCLADTGDRALDFSWASSLPSPKASESCSLHPNSLVREILWIWVAVVCRWPDCCPKSAFSTKPRARSRIFPNRRACSAGRVSQIRPMSASALKVHARDRDLLHYL